MFSKKEPIYSPISSRDSKSCVTTGIDQFHSTPLMQMKKAEYDRIFGRKDIDIDSDRSRPVTMYPTIPTLQRKANTTGLPDNLKTGVENLSGISMDNVKVHYNSSKPAQLQAHAYTQGTDIHVATGQEKHLPHESWHVVQQAQGRVAPTMQMKGVGVNDDAGLEREANEMGEKAITKNNNSFNFSGLINTEPKITAIQCYFVDDEGWYLSESKTIWVKNSNQELYTTDKVIQESNQLLKASGSFIRLKIDFTKPCPEKKKKFCNDNLFYVTPVWIQDKTIKDLYTSTHKKDKFKKDDKTIANAVMGKHTDARKASNNQFKTWADCSKAAQVIMGSKDPYQNDARVYIDQIGLRLQKSQIAKNLKEPGKFGQNYSNSFYLEAWKNFINVNKNDERLKENIHFKIDEKGYRIPVIPKTSQGARNLYDGLSDDLKNFFDYAYGSNMYADPNVGEAYLSTMESSMKNGGGGQWVYHWGGVIMKDGRDTVTLEGFSVGLSNTISSKNWTFNMYSSKGSGKTFHERQIASGHHGKRITTMVISTGKNKKISKKKERPQEKENMNGNKVPANYVIMDAGGAAGMNCLIHAILGSATRNMKVNEKLVNSTRNFLVNEGVADYNEMLDLADDSGRRVIWYLEEKNKIDRGRGVRVYYYIGDELNHQDIEVEVGADPICVFLDLQGHHFYAMIPLRRNK